MSYWNWAEEMQIGNSKSTQDTFANFGGLGLEFEKSFSNKLAGWNASLTVIMGQATGGASSSGTNGSAAYSYQASYQKFNAYAIKLNRFTRLYQRVYIQFGPMILNKGFAWPSQDGISATSGAATNFGLNLSLRFRLAPSFDFCQSIGMLMNKATTIWGVGFGYRF